MGYNTQTVSEKKAKVEKCEKKTKYFMVGLMFME